MTRRTSLSIVISIIILIIINILSLTTIHIPVGEGPRQIMVEYNAEKGEYGYIIGRVWHPLGNTELEHPLRNQQLFRRCDRIKDRWPELLFA